MAMRMKKRSSTTLPMVNPKHGDVMDDTTPSLPVAPDELHSGDAMGTQAYNPKSTRQPVTKGLGRSVAKKMLYAAKARLKPKVGK